jgi:transcriptional regulator with XRE-family HTH domain
VTGQTTGQTFFRREVFRAEMERTKQRPVHVALALDVDPRTVARWLERDGRIDPNGSNARRLAKHFGRPEDYFLVDGVAETDGAAA